MPRDWNDFKLGNFISDEAVIVLKTCFVLISLISHVDIHSRSDKLSEIHMKHPIIVQLLGLATLVAGISCARAEANLTYGDLIRRMTDLSYLATLPESGDTCAQWSSYDRASKFDEQSGKYIHWDANGDGGGFIRTEGDKVVMAEMKGPGCIWRIWSADPRAGHVRIYLDGNERPVTDLEFRQYFDGQHAPFAYPMLSYDLHQQKCQGQNLYFPIPYQKSCKIVADKDWGAYFHFVYETFPQGTTIPTFSAALVVENSSALNAVNDYFRNKIGEDPAGRRPGLETIKKTVSLAAGAVERVAELKGARAITSLRINVAFTNREDEIEGLRRVQLRITWDGQDKPAVLCPLGDFFGTAPGVNLYKTLATGMTTNGFYSLWYMPFGKYAVVELVSDDTVSRAVTVEIAHAPLGRGFDGLGYFHAKWHRDVFPLSPDRFPDWVMLRTEGRGRFCGVMLHVWNPHGGWWGEGDEKFFVDGEKFPSTFGTGSEDYFGYAWCDPHLFKMPYHAQTMTQNNHGHQSVLRWHIVDNIPFQKSFEATIEKYYKNDEKSTLYANTVYWYLAPGGTDPFDEVPVENRVGYYVKGPVVAGGFAVDAEPNGSVETQEMASFGDGKWKNNQQLWWTGAEPGAKLEITLPVEKEGVQSLNVSLTKAPDYGIVQFYFDGEKIGKPVDLFNKQVVPTGMIDLGKVQVDKPGKHKLTVEITGANPDAIKSYMFGMDRVELTTP